jgi:hypothetical protein
MEEMVEEMRRPLWFWFCTISFILLLITIPGRFETGHYWRGSYDIILAACMFFFALCEWGDRK